MLQWRGREGCGLCAVEEGQQDGCAAGCGAAGPGGPKGPGLCLLSRLQDAAGPGTCRRTESLVLSPWLITPTPTDRSRAPG